MFQRETGITESQWYGKTWRRWNDAVVEAGLVPNERQERLSSERVLEKYAEVCRHYGRPPSNIELRTYARESPNFISHNTFFKHFGDKSGVIAALRDRAIERNDQELLNLLPDAAPTKTDDSQASPNLSEGYVYLLKSGTHYKIGRSNEIERRIKQISIALPEKVELAHAIRTDDPPGIEAY